MPIRSNPNSDNHINYKSKAGSKRICCPTCRDWFPRELFVKGVCGYCNAEFEKIKTDSVQKKHNVTLAPKNGLRLPKGI